jgi:HK97 family phage portal protein
MIARVFDFQRESRSLDNPSTPWTSENIFGDYGGTADAGVPVTQETALRLGAVWRAIRILSETMASLPLFVFERQEPRGRRRAVEHPVTNLIHSDPNPNMSAFFLREFMMASAVLHGNGYGAIRRDGRGEPREVWPLLPTKVEPKIDPRGVLYYLITLTDGTREPWEQENILHIPGLGFDGIKGKSVISIARESFGLSLAAQKFGGKFFAKGGRLPGVIKLPATVRLTDEQRKNMEASWNAMVGGSENWHKAPFLDRGMEWQSIGVNPEDAQFLETRKFQTTDVARWFGVPPHLLYDLERATFSNIEHQGLEFVTHTIRPWAVRWEMEYARKLLQPEERSRFFVEHVLDGLLRGDSASRATFYAQGRQWGYLSANDARELENLPDLGEKGDVYLVPINMVNAEELAGGGPAPAPPANPPARETPPPGPADVRRAAVYGVRGLRLRRRIKAAQRPVLEAMGRKLVKVEADEVRAAVKRHLRPAPRALPSPARRSLSEFKRWLEDFYREQEGRTTQRAEPVFRNYGELIAAAAAEEVGADPGDSLTPALEVFLRDYSQAFGVREAANSRQQILALLRDAEEEASADAVDGRMDEWEEKRPGKIADREGTQLMSAVSKAVFVAAGISTLVWASSPGACEFCQGLDGLIVDVTANFVNAGEPVNGDEGSEPMIPSREVGHPPLHSACNCDVIPG